MSYIREPIEVLEWFEITGRGSVAVVKCPEGEWDPDALRGREVTLEGKPYLIWGVESHRVMRYRNKPCTENIGLLVREIEDDGRMKGLI